MIYIHFLLFRVFYYWPTYTIIIAWPYSYIWSRVNSLWGVFSYGMIWEGWPRYSDINRWQSVEWQRQIICLKRMTKPLPALGSLFLQALFIFHKYYLMFTRNSEWNTSLLVCNQKWYIWKMTKCYVFSMQIGFTHFLAFFLTPVIFHLSECFPPWNQIVTSLSTWTQTNYSHVSRFL